MTIPSPLTYPHYSITLVGVAFRNISVLLRLHWDGQSNSIFYFLKFFQLIIITIFLQGWVYFMSQLSVCVTFPFSSRLLFLALTHLRCDGNESHRQFMSNQGRYLSCWFWSTLCQVLCGPPLSSDWFWISEPLPVPDLNLLKHPGKPDCLFEHDDEISWSSVLFAWNKTHFILCLWRSWLHEHSEVKIVAHCHVAPNF